MKFQDNLFDFENSSSHNELTYVPKRLLFLFMLVVGIFALVQAQSRVEYVGGTASKVATGAAGAIEVNDDRYFAFYSKKAQVRVPYNKIDLLEYGQTVSRRVALAIVISPAF